MQINYEKQNVFDFLKQLAVQLSQCIGEMKQQFEKNPPQDNVKERCIEWKQKYSDIVNQNLNEHILKGIDKAENFDFKEFLMKINDEFQNDNDFLELLKNVNREIETLKDFIRGYLVKDSSIYYVKEL